MKIKEIHMKIIAIGLIPVFLILAFALPNTAYHSHPVGRYYVHRFCGNFHRNVNAEEGSEGCEGTR